MKVLVFEIRNVMPLLTSTAAAAAGISTARMHRAVQCMQSPPVPYRSTAARKICMHCTTLYRPVPALAPRRYSMIQLCGKAEKKEKEKKNAEKNGQAWIGPGPGAGLHFMHPRSSALTVDLADFMKTVPVKENTPRCGL